jgi:hypothetical protein
MFGAEAPESAVSLTTITTHILLFTYILLITRDIYSTMFSFHNIAVLALCTAPSLVYGHITPVVPSAGIEYQGGQAQVFKWSYNEGRMDGDPFATEHFRCDLMWGNSVGYIPLNLATLLTIHTALGNDACTESERLR